MLPAFQNTLQGLTSLLLPFSLSNLDGFPYLQYTNMVDFYTVLEDWYEGKELLATTIVNKETGQKVEKYPIKINPLKGTCRKHTSVLFGQNLDSIRFGGVPVRFLPDLSSIIDDDGENKEAEKKNQDQIQRIRAALTETWADNGGGSLFISNGILSQYLGGCVFAAKWDPVAGRINITAPEPKEFVGIPDGKDYWRLREAWIVREITEEDLVAYGITVADVKAGSGNKYWYVEHWTKTSYKITINDLVLNDDGGNPMEGENPFGLVPMVYIPHIREKGFFGQSIITEAVKGLIREINNRYTDIGDAVSDDSHNIIAIRNVRGSAKTIKLDGRTVIDLGGTTGLGGNEANPDLISTNLKSTSQSMIDYTVGVYGLYRKEVDLPAVADGEDEGSQRSSLTLSVRMWPLEAHVELERVFWTVGLAAFSKIMLKMMLVKKLKSITAEDLDVPLIIEWQPKLPRDRDALVNEVVARDSAQLGSKESLMEKLGDTANPADEIQKIKDEQEELAPPVQKTAGGQPLPKPTPPGGNPDNPKKKASQPKKVSE